MSLSEEWSKLELEITTCTKCKLHAFRRNPVPGEGNKQSLVVFVGEAPGEKEDETGRPFVGPAGKLLTELIESMGFKREDFYITNVVKCRPPGNRDPEDDEVEACTPYLMRQLQLLRPKVIVTLGRHAGRVVFGVAGLRWTSVSANHGRVYSGRVWGLEVKIIPTYHPASALYNPSVRKILEADFKNVIKPVIEEALRGTTKKRYKTLFDFTSR